MNENLNDAKILLCFGLKKLYKMTFHGGVICPPPCFFNFIFCNFCYVIKAVLDFLGNGKIVNIHFVDLNPIPKIVIGIIRADSRPEVFK